MNMQKGFYRAFEEIFRGPRDRIKSRLVFYKPFLQAIQSIYPKSSALDLGCGRGEWLEVLSESGFTPLGIDLDPDMLAACSDLNLPAQQGNALEYIKEQPQASLSLVSAFHLVEHLPFDKLLELIGDIKRSLKPGGLVILESPNPENLRVGAHTFHLDPTHIKPLPPDLLAFVCQYHGFARVKILRLQTANHILEGSTPTLMDVLTEVSPDYAVVAQLGAAPGVISTLDVLWEQDFGVNLGVLAIRYENHNNNLMVKLFEADQALRQDIYSILQKELPAQVQILRAEAKILTDQLNGEIHTLQSGFDDVIRRLRTDSENEIKRVRTDSENEIKRVRTDSENEIKRVRTELKDEIHNLKADIQGKVYRNLHVPWHTHLYRSFATLFIKAKKPWHTHLYRSWRSLCGDPRYSLRQSAQPAMAARQLAAIVKPHKADIGLIVRPEDIDMHKLESAVQERLEKANTRTYDS